MAHFAKLDSSGRVIEVHVVHNNELLDENGVEQEARGIDFLKTWSRGHEAWKQTSYNGSFRKNFAGVGYTYDDARDAFIPPKPFASWTLNEDTCVWGPPVPYPTDGKGYRWDEEAVAWVEVAFPELSQ
jgi:hypothetical protein